MLDECHGRSHANARGGLVSKRGGALTLIGFGFFLLILQPSSAAPQSAPEVGSLRGQKFARVAGGVLAYELAPSFDGSFKSASFRTNRWGMRDKEYLLRPPPNTYRIAMLGSSLTMGAGVPGDLTHESLLENRLNREGPGAPRRHYEILNFAVAGYGILQNVAVADRKAFPFAPNAVLLVVHGIEQERMISHLARLVREGAEIEYPYVRMKLTESGALQGMQMPEVRRRLARVAPDLVSWSLRRVAEICRARGVPLVAILFAEPRESRSEEKFTKLAAAVREAGIPLLNLAGTYRGHSLDSMRLQVGDYHLSAHGHEVVADRLFQLLRENDARGLKLGFAAP